MACAATALMLGVTTSAAQAQQAKPGDSSGSAAITGIFQLNTSLKDGGNFNWDGGVVQGELNHQFTPEFSAGFSARYGYESWHFSTPSSLGATAPWGSIQRPGVGINLAYQAAPDITVFVNPEIEWDYESGASAGNAQDYGAVVGATKFFSPTLVLGLGAAVFRQIDKTVVFPFLVVHWQINDTWRISNPFQASPTGGGGLEIVHTLDDNWEIAGGAAYRDYRFRLRSDGPTPDGIGRNQGIPIFVRLTRKLGPQGRLDLYAGAVADGELRVLNSNSSTVASSDYKLAPLLGLTAALNF
jgi:hypothetical protein